MARSERQDKTRIMGLDVTLVQFEDLDTEAILEFSRFAYAPCAFAASASSDLKARARELGLPENIIGKSYLGGTKISFPSKKYPQWPLVGDWSSFSTTRELMEHFTGKDIFFVLPEARDVCGGLGFFRPDWSASKLRLVEILEEVQLLGPAQIEDFHAKFSKPYVPQDLLEKVKKLNPTMIATPSEIFAGKVAQIGVMIETLDFVLSSENPKEFLLYWSD